jgi:hypothetical protein
MRQQAAAWRRARQARGAAPARPAWIRFVLIARNEAVLQDGQAWRQDLEARGLHILGNALQGPQTATTVRVRGGQVLLSDGPFTGTTQFAAGIDVVSCADRQQAIQLAATHPIARHHAIEVRPFHSQ